MLTLYLDVLGWHCNSADYNGNYTTSLVILTSKYNYTIDGYYSPNFIEIE